MPKDHGRADASDPLEQPWRSGIFKDSVKGPVWLGRTNLAGDGQADTKHHGGPNKAVLGYSAEHYPDWNRELAPLEFPHGGFGENFTISGQDELSVCVGDTYAVGDAVLQVSQPRQPCVNLARKWRLPDLPALVMKSARGGWYFRVLIEGHVEAGQDVRLVERPFPDMPIARVFALYRDGADRETALRLAACPLLSPSWRKAFAEMAEQSRAK
ncbi:MAG: MOSC domain-containing protein [Acidobacteria bacterium]|nr:MOSC domain-containing protein [Acidobacteriota bacterium]MBI3663762.1 MOSC domain-containing protein [Acidobacteriota bacterium]